jgi:hypothetical protein
MHTTFFFVLLVYYVYSHMFLHFFKTYKMCKIHKIHNLYRFRAFIGPSSGATKIYKHINIYASSGIRTRDPSNQAAADALEKMRYLVLHMT